MKVTTLRAYAGVDISEDALDLSVAGKPGCFKSLRSHSVSADVAPESTNNGLLRASIRRRPANKYKRNFTCLGCKARYRLNQAIATIYLDSDTAQKTRRAAERERKSLSSWAQEKLRKAADETEDVWPEDFFALFGSIRDETFTVPDELPASRDTDRHPV